VPDSVSVPVPIFTSEAPVPPYQPPSWMVPETVVLLLVLPTVSSFEPRR
jgi:hypothetical protein